MLTRIIITLFLVLVTLGAPLSGMVLAQAEVPARSSADQGNMLLTAIQTARAELQTRVDAELANLKRKPKIVTSTSVAVPVTLAIWNSDSNVVTYHDFTKQGVKLMPKASVEAQVRVRLDNGVNTEYEVVGGRGVVVGNIHPIFKSIGTAKQPRFSLEPAAYVPYSAGLRLPALVAAGEAYLERNVQAVFAELRANGVRSLAYPHKLLADIIAAPLVKSIIAIEHVSATSLLKGDSSEYLDKFYITLAGNEHRAYAYSRSTAQARGIVQFIPATYKSLQKLQPALLLTKDFQLGMEDPFNAIKAQIALLDYNITLLPKAVRDESESDAKSLGAYLAGMYNGGSARVRKAIAAWGKAWSIDHTLAYAKAKSEISSATAAIKRVQAALKKKGITTADKAKLNLELAKERERLATNKSEAAKYATGNLKRETILYVAKYNLVYEHFATGSRAAMAAPAHVAEALEK